MVATKTKRRAPKKTAKAKKSKTKTAKTKSKKPRKPFGGYLISFAGRSDSIQDVFGKAPMTPGDMNKKIWAFIKLYDLSNKKK